MIFRTNRSSPSFINSKPMITFYVTMANNTQVKIPNPLSILERSASEINQFSSPLHIKVLVHCPVEQDGREKNERCGLPLRECRGHHLLQMSLSMTFIG
ncbi:hypothetical protein AVEN_166908-1 [Araneus ventricosus]|uniref:Uncharacterized protein n=1 Tax=Araneus ventricosus TaxID=182803 RepID=A0A4Y2PSP7_ARAVE|nr:hypothetical protein AVEN_166908-1 [Araneus ventricosus]